MKMKIGDLEMDQSSSIRLDGNARSEERSIATPEAIAKDLKALPGSKYLPTFLLVVSAISVSGALVLSGLLLFGKSWWWGVPVPGLLTIGIVMGLFAVHFRKQMTVDRSQPADSEGLLNERKKRVLAVLSSNSEPLSVAELRLRLGWTEEALVTALAALVAEQQVIEDLDLETGHWNYGISHEHWLLGEEARSTLSIADRVEAVDYKK